jgi:hypothetical protein
MYGDFSRDSYDRCRYYTRVLMQQGRPLTDADWNEQASILTRKHIELLCVLLGQSSHATFDGGFRPQITTLSPHFRLDVGSYIVDGLTCYLPVYGDAAFTREADRINNVINEALKKLKTGERLALVLEAWEQAVNPAMHPRILEPALLNNDTAWRGTITWRLLAKATTVPVRSPSSPCDRRIYVRRRSRRDKPNSPCEVPTDEAPSFHERLYRIEIHRSGEAFDQSKPEFPNRPLTFKWSRNNGGLVYAVTEDLGPNLVLASDRFFSKPLPDENDFLEIRDRHGRSVDRKRCLQQVRCATANQITIRDPFDVPKDPRDPNVIFDVADLEMVKDEVSLRHVQCWNQCGDQLSDSMTSSYKAATVKVKVNPITKVNGTQERPGFEAQTILDADGSAIVVVDVEEPVWLKLEDDIEIRFDREANYQEGDYWLVRTSGLTESGFVGLAPEPTARSQPGVKTEASIPSYVAPLAGTRHSALLALVTAGANETISILDTEITWKHLQLAYAATQGPSSNCPSCGCQPLDVPTSPPAQPVPQPSAQPSANGELDDDAADDANDAGAGAVLSTEGAEALSRYFPAKRDLARHVPARYLNHDPQSPEYRRFRAALLVSDILEPSFEQYLAKVERCLPAPESWESVTNDARRDYELASDFRRLVSPNHAAALFT